MPAHWLQVESCRAGFKSEWKTRCSVFYPSNNALFSVGTMNADTDSASEESVKVLQGRVRYTYVWRVQQWTTAITSWVKFQNSYGKEL